MTTSIQSSKETEVSALRRAIVIERRARYVDFQGKRSTFSQFMRQTADKLCRRYPAEARWSTIRGLLRQYPNLDVATRISILYRVEELLSEPAQPEFSASNDPAVRAAKAAPTIPKPSIPKPSAEGKAKSEEGKSSIKSVVPKLQPTGMVSAPAANDLRVELDASKSNSERYNYPPDKADVQFVKGVGPKLAKLLNNLNIFTAEDLIRHYPRRHLDFQNRLLIKDLKPGQEVTILGTIRSVSAFQSKNRNISIVSCLINDGTGSISITRFIGGRSNKYLLDRYKDQYPKGAQVLASGTVELDRYKSRLQLKNAEIELLGMLGDDEPEADSLHTGRLVPVYPLTEGLGLRHLRNIIHNALDSYLDRMEDSLPAYIKTERDLPDMRWALREIHFPETPESNEAAKRRLIFDELFSIQLQLAYKRHHVDLSESGLSLNLAQGSLVDRFKALLPFKLTSAQERVFQEIVRDLAAPKPMHRLVQGDVGSGKTVVALMSLLVAIENGYQGAMMAPTEILAEQHYQQLQLLLTPLGLKCALLLGKQGARERKDVQQGLLNGQIHIVVGTHALIQEGVEFQNLGLIIIDEQHRFGVKQRAKLKAKGQNPELLTMTATPIPRTLALTLHGDLDISEIDELPPGRKPIETKLCRPSQKKEVWDFVEQEVKKGRQSYIVFPLIDESETLSAKAATAEFETLRTGRFKNLRLGLMHGRLKPQEKDEAMERFRNREFDILVSTTVIEVGVDVPNASVMVIENADRFGLAQLHQLRGRVGRGAEQSYCFLVSDMKAETTRQRLEIMTQTNDGFVVAEKDLELRGPGEFLGTRQSGLPDLFLADIVRDAKILEEARHAAIELIKKDPELSTCKLLKEKIQSRLKSLEADLISSG